MGEVLLRQPPTQSPPGKERTRTASDGRKTARLLQLRQLCRTLKSSQSSLS